MGPSNFIVESLKWSCFSLTTNIFFGSRCIRVSETSHHGFLKRSLLLNLTENIIFFVNTKREEWDLKILLFNYWNGLALGSVQTFFLEVVHTCLWNEPPQVSERVVFAEFDWKYHFFWYKNGEVGPTNFIIWLLKWSCPRLSTDIFSGGRCIHVSERSQCSFLRRSLLLNLIEKITIF